MARHDKIHSTHFVPFLAFFATQNKIKQAEDGKKMLLMMRQQYSTVVTHRLGRKQS